MSHVGRTVIAAVRFDRWNDDEVSRHVERALEAGVGGFVVFGGDIERVSRLTTGAVDAAGRPLWFAADLERGAGQQVRGLTELPPPAALARHPEPAEATRLAALQTAADARSVGLNWVLAPVLDVDAEPDNPIVATRSFSADPRVVSRLGSVWIQACQAVGPLACAKHFPGHGRTLGDSHVELPTVVASAEALADDLGPFADVSEVAGSVMVAHVAYPALGTTSAATVSPEIVRDLLRGRIGFEGLVATDAMIMSGIGEDDAEAAVGALRAGCDVILYPSDPLMTVEAVARAADADPALAEHVAAAVVRSEQTLANVEGRMGEVGLPAADAAELALGTIVDRTSGTGGWRRSAGTAVSAVSDDPEIGPPAGRDGRLGEILARDLESAGWLVVDAGAGSEQRVVVVAATPRGWKGHGRLSDAAERQIREELARARSSLLVLLGHDRWLAGLGVPGICAWSTESAMERVAAVWLDRWVDRTAGDTP